MKPTVRRKRRRTTSHQRSSNRAIVVARVIAPAAGGARSLGRTRRTPGAVVPGIEMARNRKGRQVGTVAPKSEGSDEGRVMLKTRTELADGQRGRRIRSTVQEHLHGERGTDGEFGSELARLADLPASRRARKIRPQKRERGAVHCQVISAPLLNIPGSSKNNPERTEEEVGVRVGVHNEDGKARAPEKGAKRTIQSSKRRMRNKEESEVILRNVNRELNQRNLLRRGIALDIKTAGNSMLGHVSNVCDGSVLRRENLEVNSAEGASRKREGSRTSTEEDQFLGGLLENGGGRIDEVGDARERSRRRHGERQRQTKVTICGQ
jgi:hypothetical protein